MDDNRIVIAGASGFVGSALTAALRDRGYRVESLTRSDNPERDQIAWDPAHGRIDASRLAGARAVVTLAGASIAGGLWTRKRKTVLMDSRVDTTSTLAKAIASIENRPQVFVSTSAVGFYGNRPGETLTEQSARGDGFLADVCESWEGAAEPARTEGVRVVHPRFGLVLDGNGGVLPIMVMPFLVGLGGKFGDGQQFMSWIALTDLVEILVRSIEDDSLIGPVNAVAPEPVRNAEFTSALGAAMKRPTFMTIPKKAATLIGGELVKDLLLPDQRAIPARLLEGGFEFRFPTVQSCLKAAFSDE